MNNITLWPLSIDTHRVYWGHRSVIYRSPPLRILLYMRKCSWLNPSRMLVHYRDKYRTLVSNLGNLLLPYDFLNRPVNIFDRLYRDRIPTINRLLDFNDRWHLDILFLNAWSQYLNILRFSDDIRNWFLNLSDDFLYDRLLDLHDSINWNLNVMNDMTNFANIRYVPI